MSDFKFLHFCNIINFEVDGNTYTYMEALEREHDTHTHTPNAENYYHQPALLRNVACVVWREQQLPKSE